MHLQQICWTIFAASLIHVSLQQELDRKREMALANLLKNLIDGHDVRVSPFKFDGQRVKVAVTLELQEFHSINSDRMEFATRMNLNRSWNDPRLDFRDYMVRANLSGLSRVVLRNVSKIWKPDIDFLTERQARLHNITFPNEVAFIYSDGTVIYLSRYSAVQTCELDLQNFPFDLQICHIDIASSTYTNSEMELLWGLKRESETSNKERSLLLPEKGLDLQSFELGKILTESCSTAIKAPCLTASFELDRNNFFYIITTYFSSVCVVLVSYVGYFINPHAIPARVGIGTTAVYNMVTQLFIGGLSLPQVPYVKAVDVWLAAGIILVFYSLIEYAVLSMLMKAERQKRLMEQAETIQLNPEDLNDLTSGGLLEQIGDYLMGENPRGIGGMIEFVDFVSQVAVPVFLVVFIIAYVIYYVFSV